MKRVVEIQGNLSALLEEMLGTRAARRGAPSDDRRHGRGADPVDRDQAGVPGAWARRRRRSTGAADRPSPGRPKPRPTPARALSEAERGAVLEVLHSERFVDLAPAEVFATLLDEGRYLGSVLTGCTGVSGRERGDSGAPQSASASGVQQSRSCSSTAPKPALELGYHPSCWGPRSGPTSTCT